MSIKFFSSPDSRHPMAKKGRVTYKGYKIGKLPRKFNIEEKDFFTLAGFTFVIED